jgi:predicted secreted protein
MILKGNNFRILTLVGSKYKCIGMSSGCTVTLTSNTEESSTKDDVGLASKPTVVSKSWTVSVDSLNVTDAAAILTAIKSLTPFTLMWDETSVTDNQTGEQAAFARTGQAYLNDATFNFNDRENSTKQLKFTGTGELSKITTTPTYEPVDASVYTKGQFVRLFLGSDNTTTPAAVIAAARQLSFHVSMSLENATTKDTPGDWQIQEPTGLSYDISSTALMRGNDTISSSVAGKSLADLEDIYEAGTPVKFQIANVSGDNQRTKGAVIVSGSVIIATLTLNGPNRQNADYTTALNGYGAYTVGA